MNEGVVSPQPPIPSGYAYAGFWRRFAAFVIDFTVLAFFINALYWFVIREMQDAELEDARKVAGYVMPVLRAILIWCYFAGMESSPLRATLGKLALGIYVTDMSGQGISFARATGRYFAKIISGMILMIGYMMAGWTRRKQALHDTIAGCLVLRK